MDRTYVSEFTRFMDSFLVEHPEVLDDQHRRWHILWERADGPATESLDREDRIPLEGSQFTPHVRAELRESSARR